MKNPALILGANPSIQALMGTVFQSGISLELLEYVGLRVGQMTNCELCIGESITRADGNPTTRDKIEYVLHWQAAGVFSEQEQAALELTEAITKLNKKYQSVPDALWTKLESFFSEKELAALVLFISAMNMFTRINVATRQLTAEWA